MSKGCSSCSHTFGDSACKTCPFYPDFWDEIDPCFAEGLRSDHSFYSIFVEYQLLIYDMELREVYI